MFAAGWNNVPGGRQHHGLLWNAGGGFLRNAAVRSGFLVFARSVVQRRVPGRMLGKLMALAAALEACGQPVG